MVILVVILVVKMVGMSMEVAEVVVKMVGMSMEVAEVVVTLAAVSAVVVWRPLPGWSPHRCHL
jgi:hypothetical protein